MRIICYASIQGFILPSCVYHSLRNNSNIFWISATKTPDVPSILKQRSSPLPEMYVHAVEADTGLSGDFSDDTHSSLESPSSHQENSHTDDQESLDSDWQLWKVIFGDI